MKNLIQLWWKFIRWFATLGIMLWVIVLPLMPVYGLLQPWPQAQEKLKEEGFAGLALLIGTSSHSEHSVGSAGGSWRKETQRSYIILPDSLRRWEIVTFSQTEGSGINGVEQVVVRSHWLVPLFVLWILAGVFSVQTIRVWLRKKMPDQVAGGS